MQKEITWMDLHGLVIKKLICSVLNLISDYSDFSYTKWDAGEPSEEWHGNPEDCLAVYKTGYWNDDSCDIDRHGYVCQVTQPFEKCIGKILTDESVIFIKMIRYCGN